MRAVSLSQSRLGDLGFSVVSYWPHQPRRLNAAGAGLIESGCRRSDSGEVFPVAILFVGVLLTILIGLHVVLVSIGRTAVQAAADRGVTAAQSAPLGLGECDALLGAPEIGIRECEGVISTQQALQASGSMVRRTRPPDIDVDETAGIVTAVAHGAVISPIFGAIEIAGYACGPLDLVEDGTPSRADASTC